MKKIKILSLALVVFASMFTMSCDEDPIVVEENEIANGTQTFVYSVQVKQSSLNSGRAQGLAGVNVTVNQNGGIHTKTTDATGIVSFDNMKQGYVSVFILAPAGFTSINTSDYLDCEMCDVTQLDVDQLEYQQLEVTLPKQGATVRGNLFADLDFNGNTPIVTVPTTAVVIARLSNDYEPNVYKTNVQANGLFEFTNLPEGVNIELSIDFKTINNTITPSEERALEFNQGVYLDVNNPVSLGNITLFFN